MSDTEAPAPGGRPMVGKVRTRDEHAALLTYHIAKIREQRASVVTAQGPVDEAKAALKEEQDELSSRFDQAQIDLGRAYTRKYLEALIADGDAKIRDLVEHEKMRALDKTVLNQPVYGVQAELFPGEETPSLVRDELAWEAEGYLRGLRGDLDELQAGDPPEFHQKIMQGYRNGQAEARNRYLKGADLHDRAAAPEPEGDDEPDLNAAPAEPEEPEPGTPEAKAKERESVARAKESLEGMKGDGDGDGFEATEEELSGQSTRKAVRARREADPGEPANKVPA